MGSPTPNTFYFDISEQPHFSSQCSSQRMMIEHFNYTRDLQQMAFFLLYPQKSVSHSYRWLR